MKKREEERVWQVSHSEGGRGVGTYGSFQEASGEARYTQSQKDLPNVVGEVEEQPGCQKWDVDQLHGTFSADGLGHSSGQQTPNRDADQVDGT